MKRLLTSRFNQLFLFLMKCFNENIKKKIVYILQIDKPIVLIPQKNIDLLCNLIMARQFLAIISKELFSIVF